VHISEEQHNKFTAMYTKNFRPPQPVFGREIQYLSEQKFSTSAGSWVYTADTASKVEQEEEWEKAFPACAGNEQSPISISLAMSRQNQHNDVKVNFHSTTTGQIYKDGRHVQVFVVPEQAGYVSVENNDYSLLDYTFMLPAGTELEGAKFECETLLICENVAGARMIMSIVFNRGPRNMHLAHAGWQEFTDLQEFQRVALGHAFNPGDLVPLNTNYYMYDGSLPWPPCTEGITWLVFETPMTLSFEQIQAYPYKGSFRPARPLGQRVVDHLSRHHSDLIGYGTGSNALCSASATAKRRRVGEKTADRSACFDWGYGTHNGPYKWGRYFEKCAALEQSPVNIDTCTQKTRTGNQLQKKWVPLNQLEIYNNGLNVVIEAPFGETIFEYNTYQVESISFHLQSEHQLDGHPFLMEMQVKHTNKATKAILNLAIMFQLGPDNNPFLESIHWYELPRVRGTSVSIKAEVNLYDALPADQGYYTYKGSITAPPCTEGAIWVVMRDLNSMSGLQESQFPFENNFRPPQAMNGRDVYFLSEGEDAFDVAYQYKTEWAAGSIISMPVLSMVICTVASVLASCML
jgi:carbonic anhydrase